MQADDPHPVESRSAAVSVSVLSSIQTRQTVAVRFEPRKAKSRRVGGESQDGAA